jgi:hypothetical protein
MGGQVGDRAFGFITDDGKKRLFNDSYLVTT